MYIGNSRSVRSQEAIEHGVMPISHFNSMTIEECCSEYSDSEKQILLNYSVATWKYAAKNMIIPKSWHHTGSYFNKTNHYCLSDIADYLLKEGSSVINAMKIEREGKKMAAKKTIFDKIDAYAVIRCENWEKSGRHFKKLDDEIHAGVVIENWLYYVDEFGKTRKLNVTARRCVGLNQYKNAAELVKQHPEYKGILTKSAVKQMFNK